MAEAHKAGLTLRAIVEVYGLTRERVRQIIARREVLLLAARHNRRGDCVRDSRCGVCVRSLGRDAGMTAIRSFDHQSLSEVDPIPIRLAGSPLECSGGAGHNLGHKDIQQTVRYRKLTIQ